ncbi:hypothetical protein N7G274_009714 [Stereocaulon virgatum]|uniref:Rhodopsin domain-containing protein n=1 Tax=Stereocaulon virgatum TaxID=373712 RepID=A0ABR3ZXA7_9LECA
MMTRTGTDTISQLFMTWMIVYGLSIAFAKCAILLLYVRVFTTIKRTFTIAAGLVGSAVVLIGLANTFGIIFQCSPPAFAWNKAVDGGHCIDIVAFSRYMAIPNVVTGAVMLVMPLPVVWNLKIDVSAKIALTATFLHGIIGFIASCARLSILFSTDLNTVTSGTSLGWTIWTINEPANYIIAACLPTLRPIFIRILPASFFILSRKRSTRSDNPSAKVSWPRGSFRPKIEYGSRGFQSQSRLTGPWYASNHETHVDEKNGENLKVRDWTPTPDGEAAEPAPPRRSYTLERSPAYDMDKKQVMVEKRREMLNNSF